MLQLALSYGALRGYTWLLRRQHRAAAQPAGLSRAAARRQHRAAMRSAARVGCRGCWRCCYPVACSVWHQHGRQLHHQLPLSPATALRYREHLPCGAAAAGQLHLPGSAVAGFARLLHLPQGQRLPGGGAAAANSPPPRAAGGCRGGVSPYIHHMCTQEHYKCSCPHRVAGGVQGGGVPLSRVHGQE